MGPDLTALLDEMTKRLDEHDAKFVQHLADHDIKLDHLLVDRDAKLDQRLVDLDTSWAHRFEDFTDGHNDRVAALEAAAASFEQWRPGVEGSVDALRLEVKNLAKHWDRAVKDSASGSGLLGSAPSTAERPPAGSTVDMAYGHRHEQQNRVHGSGVVTTLHPHPVKGTQNSPHSFSHHAENSSRPVWDSGGSSSSIGRLPKLQFPMFDGSQPRLWVKRSEDYFELYGVEPSLWIKVATLHFSSAAARWLPSVERRLSACTWQQFTHLVLDRFGREHHELLVRQMFHIKQLGKVHDYIEQFSELMDQLSAYESQTDPIHYITRFIDGLNDEIRPAVFVQRPVDLDTAFLIARLQEEVGEPMKRKEFHRSDRASYGKLGKLSFSALPQQFKQDHATSSTLETKLPPKSAEERWSALRAYRRAKGLCQFCAEKWSKGHKCADTVQLNAMQEVLELFPVQADLQSDGSDSEQPTEQLFLTLSVAAISGASSPKTLCLQGEIQGIPVRILVDSGSSHTFISDHIASQLSGICPVPLPLQVQVANCQLLQCTSQFPNAAWSVQCYTFCSDLKVLSLSAYDMILGLDWLDTYSPMQIHWQHKWMKIPYNDSIAVLYGLLPRLPVNSLLQVYQVHSVDSVTTYDQSPELQALLEEFGSLFAVPSGLPPPRDCDHTIPLVPGAAPVSVRPYRLTPALKDEVESQVQDMLASDIIQRSTSPFSSAVLLVKKKDSTWRFCIDYRQLNAITVKGKYPVPIIDELLDELSGASWFSKLDLRAGFHQIRMQQGEEYKTAFQTHLGHFEFRVMPFGLTGAPGTFLSAMNTTLGPYLRKFILVFFDDILIYSKSFDEHLHHLRLTFELLSKDQWFVKQSKCAFAQRSIAYLGHTVSAQGVATDPTKIDAITHWPSPQSAKELRSFLGLAGYYRKFVRNFSIIAKPLFELLKKGALFVWTTAHSSSFAALKHALSHAPVLALPDFSKPFCIETDASGSGIGAVLTQEGHPLAYISRTLGPRSLGLSTYEKEYLAILLAVQQWRAYLQHSEFSIFTDQKSLVQLTDQRLHTQWQQKVFSKLLGLQYKVIYKKGSDNRVADALSRCPAPNAHCAAISTGVPSWINEVLDSYTNDSSATDLLTKLSVDPTAVPRYTLTNGIIRYNSRLWIGNCPTLRLKLIQACHSSALGGHSGIPVTYGRIKKLFYWPGMKRDVIAFIQGCLICQQAKPDRQRLPGLLQPLPVPSRAWQIISLDFIEGLPTSGSANCILVVIDSFTKYGHFIPLHHPFTAMTVARSFIQNIYRLHGMPDQIVSDRDRIFTSQLWKELFRLADVQLAMSSSYHPQSDGQTERLNQTLETFLRCFVSACPSKWSQWLALAEYWYNTTTHSATGFSPFEALYGYPPKHFGISSLDAVPDQAPLELSQWLQERRLMEQLVQQHLTRSKNRMKKQADKHRSECSFDVGDMVFVKLQPYVQSSLSIRSNQKLAFRFYGPFQILERIGSVAYRLALPAHSSIHPVFHVSQLKRAVLPPVQVSSSFPADLDTPRFPEKILQHRRVPDHEKQVDQVLIKWSNWPTSMATWEDRVRLQQAFPRAPAWGQAGSQDPGIVGTTAPPTTLPDVRGPSTRQKKPSTRVTGKEWIPNLALDWVYFMASWLLYAWVYFRKIALHEWTVERSYTSSGSIGIT
ncbi:hypothetical protein U9M48_040918 [Paspalum notatum var. saurae]|uniref:Gag-pol polyprotein n=1 Tax=Paspalum notatum var. saurae TaxID=547442 RepID=A0AAQ3UN44_PASNO